MNWGYLECFKSHLCDNEDNGIGVKITTGVGTCSAVKC